MNSCGGSANLADGTGKRPLLVACLLGTVLFAFLLSFVLVLHMFTHGQVRWE